MTFEEVRASFPVLARLAYLNAGTFGPLSTATAEAVAAEGARDLAEGRSGMPYFLRVLDLRAQVRAAVAALVGAAPAQVALTSSTTDGCGIVTAGLGLGPEDEIVTTTDEHFGLLGALGASPARVVVAAPEPDAIVAAVTSRTRLLALSQVLWTTGAVLPVRELRERTGVPVLVDGAQSVGAVPVDVAGIDFLTVSGQKWLCGPDTTGALVVADPERLRVTSPSYFGQEAYEPDGSFTPRAGADRFEPNWWAPGALAGVLAALEQRPEWAFARARTTAARCRELLAASVEVVTPGAPSTLVAFRPPDGEEAAAVVERLDAAGVHVREIPRRRLVRVSCGYWTSEDDLQRLVAAL
jgi:L-cysteine/cystine lyase